MTDLPEPRRPALSPRQETILRVVIEDHVFIGTRAMILPGVTLSRGAAVGAGAIVTRDVPPHHIVAGTPARKIGTRPDNLSYNASYCRMFW